jgi:hypothetical protein
LAAAAMAITFKLCDPRRYLGLVALAIAAADEVDKKGSFEDQLLYIENIWRCARETRKTFIGVLIHAI